MLCTQWRLTFSYYLYSDATNMYLFIAWFFSRCLLCGQFEELFEWINFMNLLLHYLCWSFYWNKKKTFFFAIVHYRVIWVQRRYFAFYIKGSSLCWYFSFFAVMQHITLNGIESHYQNRIRKFRSCMVWICWF